MMGSTLCYPEKRADGSGGDTKSNSSANGSSGSGSGDDKFDAKAYREWQDSIDRVYVKAMAGRPYEQERPSIALHFVHCTKLLNSGKLTVADMAVEAKWLKQGMEPVQAVWIPGREKWAKFMASNEELKQWIETGDKVFVDVKALLATLESGKVPAPTAAASAPANGSGSRGSAIAPATGSSGGGGGGDSGAAIRELESKWSNSVMKMEDALTDIKATPDSLRSEMDQFAALYAEFTKQFGTSSDGEAVRVRTKIESLLKKCDARLAVLAGLVEFRACDAALDKTNAPSDLAELLAETKEVVESGDEKAKQTTANQLSAKLKAFEKAKADTKFDVERFEKTLGSDPYVADILATYKAHVTRATAFLEKLPKPE